MRARRLAVPVLLLALAFAGASAGCASPPPSRWPTGGAPLDVPRAQWVTRGGMMVDVTPDGRVLVNGVHELGVDRAGRVFTAEGDPVALLEADGRVVGPGDEPLGAVGVLTASRPEEAYAWIGVAQSGEVVRFDEDGERSSFGVWSAGCLLSPRAHQLCTLLTHLLADRADSYARSNGPSVGVGIGVGVGVGR